MKLNNAFCMPWFLLHLLGVLLLCLPTLLLAQEVHNYVFVVEAKPVKRLCKTYNIITVNGQFPGPTLAVREGDSLNIYVVNRARYNITLHWHGIRQLRNGWADGPVYITQCPIQPGGSYTYRFNVEGQRGTLWWHAHSSWLRATVYGALIIYPKLGCSYPFAIPNREAPIILGEWWNSNPIAVVNQANRTGAAPNVSDAFTINGQPGDLYNCSRSGATIIPVSWGETILLRIINAALNAELFFAIAGHRMTIVAADASYIKPFTTSVLMIAPGQTTDVLLVANQPPARYYMAARAYSPAPNVPFDNTTTTAILQYRNTWYQRGSSIPLPPLFPRLPAYNDTATVTAYSNSHRSLNSERFPAHVPATVDEDLFFTVGLGLFNCSPGRTCGGPNNTRFTASMNNVSFVLPRSLSILQAQQFGVNGVFTANFPPFPPVQFDYTGNVSRALWQPMPGTEALTVRYGSVVQLVLQDTNIFAGENHPIHLHGYSFYVLAEGFGNFDPKSDVSRFNLFDPPKRNTIGVPVKGWTVIRFVADNPGAWLLHCHFDNHLTWGLAMVLLVENGFGELESVKPAPADLPVC